MLSIVQYSKQLFKLGKKCALFVYQCCSSNDQQYQIELTNTIKKINKQIKMHFK